MRLPLSSRGASLLGVVACAACLAGCDDDDRLDDGGVPLEVLTIGEIAAVVDVMNDRQIAQARLAPARASSEEVLALADDLIDDHAEVGEEQDELFELTRVSPVGSDLSRAIVSGNAVVISHLELLAGPEFDRAFVQASILQHRQNLGVLASIVPTVEDEDYRGFLEGFRSMEISHLDSAMRVQNELFDRGAVD